MRILLFSSSYAPRFGGLETVTRQLTSGLTERGHEVTVETNRYPLSLPGFETIDGVPVHRRIYPDLFPAVGQTLGSESLLKKVMLAPLTPFALARLLHLTAGLRPDLINIHYFSYPSIYMLAVARLLRVPVVFSFHGSDISAVPYPANYERGVRFAIATSRVCTACSASLLSFVDMARQGRRRPEFLVTYNGIASRPPDEPEVLPALPTSYLACVGRLVEKKGCDIAIRAIALLKDRGTVVSFVVAGDGPKRREYEALARDLGIASQVLFLGATDAGTTRAIIRRAQMLVVPSRLEAFGMVCLEAMVEKKAVVAADSGGLPEIVLDGETGRLFRSEDPSDLASAIAELLADSERAARMGAAGRERAFSHFSLDMMIDAYLHAFARALQPSW